MYLYSLSLSLSLLSLSLILSLCLCLSHSVSVSLALSLSLPLVVGSESAVRSKMIDCLLRAIIREMIVRIPTKRPRQPFVWQKQLRLAKSNENKVAEEFLRKAAPPSPELAVRSCWGKRFDEFHLYM
jgi:hypothetical protein